MTTVTTVASAYVAEFNREVSELASNHTGYDDGKIVYVGYEGEGNPSKPDTIRLIMTMEGMQREYDMAVEQSSVMTEELKKMFLGLGFDKDALKTLNFNVNLEYESYQVKDKSWKRRFEGYIFLHRTKVEFPADHKQLGKILYALGHANIRPEFRIEYTVVEPEKCKNDLLTEDGIF